MAKSFSDDPSVKLFTLQGTDIQVTITNVGATVTSLSVPDKQGELASYADSFWRYQGNKAT